MKNQRLIDLRIDKNLTQADMADFLKITRQAYNHYENGKREANNQTIIKLSEFFNVSVDYLLQNSDIKNPYKEAPEGKDDSIANEYQTTIKRQDDLQQIIDLVRDYCNEYVIRDCDEKEALIAIYNLVPRKEIKLEGSKKQNKKEQKLKADFMDMWLDFYKSQKQDRD